MRPRSDNTVPTGTAGDADAVLDRVAAAIRGRVDARRATETQLGAFAFREGRATTGRDHPDDSGPADWRFFVTRALAAMAEPDAVAVLETLRDGGLPLASLDHLVSPAERDRLATADRIGDLAAAGLVGRELESDMVALTPLGEALLGLVDELSTRARDDRR
jgi:hypothetical protein